MDSYRQAAQSFEHAILQDETFALPYAQLCLIKVRESWMASEVSSLERAAYFCQQAERLAPENINTVIAKTELLARTGELEQALLLRDRLLNPQIDNADAYATFAELAWSQGINSNAKVLTRISLFLRASTNTSSESLAGTKYTQ